MFEYIWIVWIDLKSKKKRLPCFASLMSCGLSSGFRGAMSAAWANSNTTTRPQKNDQAPPKKMIKIDHLAKARKVIGKKNIKICLLLSCLLRAFQWDEISHSLSCLSETPEPVTGTQESTTIKSYAWRSWCWRIDVLGQESLRPGSPKRCQVNWLGAVVILPLRSTSHCPQQ